MGADEDAVFQDRSLEDGDPVLELDPIADDDADVDVDAFGQDAVGADACSLAHLRLVPDPRARSDRRRGRDVSGGVDLRSLVGLGLPRQDDVAVAGRPDHRRPALGQGLQAGLQAAVERGGQRPVEEGERSEAIGLRASLPQAGTLDQAVELAQSQAAGSHLMGRALAKPEAAQATARDPSGGFQPGIVHRLQDQGQAGSVGAAEDGHTARLEDSQPFAQDVDDFPAPEMLDHVNRKDLVRAVIFERLEMVKVTEYIGLEAAPAFDHVNIDIAR